MAEQKGLFITHPITKMTEKKNQSLTRLTYEKNIHNDQMKRKKKGKFRILDNIRGYLRT